MSGCCSRNSVAISSIDGGASSAAGSISCGVARGRAWTWRGVARDPDTGLDFVPQRTGATTTTGCARRNSTGALTVLVLAGGRAGVAAGSCRTRAAMGTDDRSAPRPSDVGCRSMRAGVATARTRASRTAAPSSLRAAGVLGASGSATVCVCTAWTRSARRPDASLCLRSMRAGVATARTRASRTATPSSLRAAGVLGASGSATVCACAAWTRSARRPDASLCLRSMRAGVATAAARAARLPPACRDLEGAPRLTRIGAACAWGCASVTAIVATSSSVAVDLARTS